MAISSSRPSGVIGCARRFAVLGGLVAALAVPAAASANTGNVSTGRAYDVAVKSSLLGTLLVVGPDTGTISSNTTSHHSSCAGSLTTTLIDGSLLCSSVDTTNEGATSKASVASFSAFIPSAPAISGTLISSQASATCRNGGTVLAGSSAGTLTVGSNTYNLAAPPNTVIPLGPLGSITINEQKKTGNSISVNAVDIRTVLGTQVVVAHSQAGVSNCAG